jgi:hypothetical protein
VQLCTTLEERQYHDRMSNLFGIVVATDELEDAYSNARIDPDQCVGPVSESGAHAQTRQGTSIRTDTE